MMPPLSHREWLMARVDAFIFDVFRLLRQGIAFIFIAGILLVSGRALIIGVLALIEKLRPAPLDHPEYQPRVTILIPAYNEESVIVDTVAAALASGYPRLEVLVVDDGSADRTAELVRDNFGRDRRVRLLQQPNRGKPAALNHGLAEATGEIIVSIDADTIVDPEAVPRLVRHFADPKVGAVAGNVKVANRNSWITRWQALEYITSQNLEKRAFDLLNCIPVVPGAAGAWRADVLRDSGGFSGDTVAEDTDLTLTIRRNGWKILYDEDAIGRTEVPETVDALIRQRFRWTFGTLQAVWKHRDTAGNPKYGTLGWVAIPNIFLFQIILPLVSPVIDLLFMLSLRPLGPRAAARRRIAAALDFAGRGALADFLRALHADRSLHLRRRLRARKERRLDAARPAHHPALLLSPDDVRRALPLGEGSRARPPGRLARRGIARAAGSRAPPPRNRRPSLEQCRTRHASNWTPLVDSRPRAEHRVHREGHSDHRASTNSSCPPALLCVLCV